MEQKKQVSAIDQQRWQLAEFARQDWIATVEEGTTLEDVKNPAFWANVSVLMKPFDHIDVRCEDGSWAADFIVLGCDRNWARVHMKHHYELTTADVSLTQALHHEIKWKGPIRMFCVIRLSDQSAIQEKLRTKEEAALWLNQFETSTA